MNRKLKQNINLDGEALNSNLLTIDYSLLTVKKLLPNAYCPLPKKKVNSFTILEVTIVMALMSIIITLVTVGVNRFNKQMKVNEEVQIELNQFYAFRSNLWNECYQADSMNVINQEFVIYYPKKEIQYKVDDEFLWRKMDTDWLNTNIKAEKISESIENDNKKVEIFFDWKGESMKFHYLCKPSIKRKIDLYFENLNP